MAPLLRPAVETPGACLRCAALADAPVGDTVEARHVLALPTVGVGREFEGPAGRDDGDVTT